MTTDVAVLTAELPALELECDIPQSLSGAYNWTSQNPERRFAQIKTDYVQTLLTDLAAFESEAAKGGTSDRVQAEFARYRENFRKHYVAAITSDSRCASPFVTGPANFPAERMRKRADIAGRRWSELIEWRKRVVAAVLRELRPDLAPVMSSDENAIERLADKLRRAEAEQVHMSDVNAAHRRYLKNPATLDGSALSDAAKEIIRRYVPPYDWESHPFPPYALSNNSAEIRRIKERIEKISKAQAAPAAQIDGVNARLEDCPADNRVRLFFPGKPAEDVRKKLKGRGFRWTPSLGCWQAYRNTWSLQLAKEIAGGSK